VTQIFYIQSNRDNIMAFGDFTVTRASTKNVLGSAGLYVSVANNVPAFEFNTDGTYRGLLVEPGATTRVANSAFAGTLGFNNPTSYSFIQLGGGTREIKPSIGISGANAVEITAGTGDRRAYLDRADTWENVPYTIQLLVEAYTGSGNSQFFIINGRIAQVQLNQFTGFNPAGPFPQLISHTFTPTAGSGALRLGFGTSSSDTLATNNDRITISGVDIKTGTVGSSLIIHTGSGTASRAADSVTLTSASSLIGQTANTLYIEGEIQTRTGADDACIFALTDGTSDEAIVVRSIAANGRIGAVVRDGGVDQAEITSGSFTTGVFKCAVASAVDDVAFYLNGSSVGTDTGATHPALSVFQFGGTVATVAPAGRPVWFRAISDFPSRIANATLTTLTTL